MPRLRSGLRLQRCHVGPPKQAEDVDPLHLQTPDLQGPNLQTDKELDVLRKRPDFQKLLSEAEAKAKSK